MHRDKVKLEKDPTDGEKEILYLMGPNCLGSRFQRKPPYSMEMVNIIVISGLCPSAGGARGPISSIVSFIDHDVGERSVVLSRLTWGVVVKEMRY